MSTERLKSSTQRLENEDRDRKQREQNNDAALESAMRSYVLT
jgi:hypothetical protein